MATLCQQLAEGQADVALIQEPWLYKGRIRGLTNTGGTVYSAVPCNNTRPCIYIRSLINALPLLEFCSRDKTTVRITYANGGIYEELIVTSAYLPIDSDEPPPNKEVRISLNTAIAGKINSSLVVMPTCTTLCGGTPAPIQEEKA
jgi:hypothetical protein